MDVILLERVEKLGAIGDVVKVKDGFARNYLLPNKKALRANEANRKVFEANRARIEADNASRRTDAEKEAKNFEGLSVTLIRQSSNTGQLYGSVAVRDLVEALEAGLRVTEDEPQPAVAEPVAAEDTDDEVIDLREDHAAPAEPTPLSLDALDVLADD